MSSHPLREITVGPGGADVVGCDGRAIQIAVDALVQRGGGTVRILPGEYELIGSIRLSSGIRMIGERDGTILRRGPLAASELAVDADISEREITPADAIGFAPGMSVCMRDDNSGWTALQVPYTVTDVSDGVLHLSDYLTEERYAESGGMVVNVFPMILAYCAEGVVIDGLTLDASVDDPAGVLKWCRTSVLQSYRCPGIEIRHVVAANGSGDGIIVAKSSIGAIVEDCIARDNGYHGIHPGSHSARFTLRRCEIVGNGSDGLYVCWGVRGGVFEDNHIHHNGWRHFRSGISIGHKDTDCLFARNHVHDNAKFGICIRRKTEANGAHRGEYRENVIENNGSKPDDLAETKASLPEAETIGCGVNVSGVTHDLVFEANTIRETRCGDDRTQRHAVRLGEGVRRVRMSGNVITGHPDGPVVDASGSGDHELQSE